MPEEGKIENVVDDALTMLCLQGLVECVGTDERDGELMYSVTDKGKEYVRKALTKAGISPEDVKSVPVSLFLAIVGPNLR